MPKSKRGLLALNILFVLALAAVAVLGVAAFVDDAPSFVGNYAREFVGAGGKVTESLEIKEDKSVTWTSNYSGREPVVQTGIWNTRDKTLIVVLGKRNGEAMPAAERVVFERKGADLKGRTFDKNVHGNDEMIFKRNN